MLKAALVGRDAVEQIFYFFFVKFQIRTVIGFFTLVNRLFLIASIEVILRSTQHNEKKGVRHFSKNGGYDA